MVEQKFIDKIEDLRLNTSSSIDDVQSNICPMIRNIYLNHQYEYWYEGYRYILWETGMHLYAVNEIPFCYDNEIKNTTFIDTLDNLIADDKVWPFLMFIQGQAIQWSKITVIHDYDYTYLKIADCDIYALEDESFYTDIVVFPLGSKKIRYGEDNDVLIGTDRKGFYFDKNGARVENVDFADLSIRLEILDDDVYYKEINIKNLTSLLKFDNLDAGFVPTLNNILVWSTGGLFIHQGAETNFDNRFNGAYGTFKLITDAQTTTAKWAILMYNKASLKSKSYLYDRASTLSQRSIEELFRNTEYQSEDWNTVIDPLIQKFDFNHDISKTYSQNVSNALKYITQYDFRLWRDTFMQDFPMKSYTYTGKEFKAMADGKGYVHWSRKHGEFIEDTVMVFVNSKLYKYSIDIIYESNTVHIPVYGIVNDDHVEVVLFEQANNTILDIIIPDSNTAIDLPTNYDFGDCYLMTNDPHNAVYDVFESGNYETYYRVDFLYSTIYNVEGYVVDKKLYFEIDVEVVDTTLIIGDVSESKEVYVYLNDSYYYGKTLKLVPRNQFRFYESKNKAGEYKIVLPTTFRYCHDEVRYMVFVNSKRISNDEYTLTIPSMERPFDRIVLYLSTVLEEGDYVDIYYIPVYMEQKYVQDSISMVGLLTLDEPNNYPKVYPFSKETTFVFVNGLKVNPLEIRDVDQSHMLINVDKYKRDENGNIIIDEQGRKVTNPYYISSVYNVQVLEYATGNKEVAGYQHGLYEQFPTYDPEAIDYTQTAYDDWKSYIKTLLEKYKGGAITLDGEIIYVESKPVIYFTEDKARVEVYTLIAEGDEPAYAGLQFIYGELYAIETIEASYKDSFGSLKSVVYDAVLDYYLDNENATTGMPFVYDFETRLWSPISTTAGVNDITLYPDADKFVDYEIIDTAAEDEDVLAGQQYIPV